MGEFLTLQIMIIHMVHVKVWPYWCYRIVMSLLIWQGRSDFSDWTKILYIFRYNHRNQIFFLFLKLKATIFNRGKTLLQLLLLTCSLKAAFIVFFNSRVRQWLHNWHFWNKSCIKHVYVYDFIKPNTYIPLLKNLTCIPF